MKTTELQKKIRSLGYALSDQDLRRNRGKDYLGQRLMHKLLLDKLYKAEKRS